MTKHLSVVNIHKVLKRSMDLSSAEFPDYWDADLHAFALKRFNRLVYINTWQPLNPKIPRYLKRNIPHYYVALEVHQDHDPKDFKVFKVLYGVTAQRLIDEIRSFLEL